MSVRALRMSDAVEGAEVILYGVSKRYKESANCRLEMQYCHQQDVEMLPLMMEQGYRATGWLGLLLGTRVYFNFHPAAVATQELFLKQIDAVQRDLGGPYYPDPGAAGCGGPLLSRSLRKLKVLEK